MSSYFSLATGTENVGIFYTIAYVLVFFLFLNLHKFIKISGKANLLHFAILFKIIIITSLVLVEPSWFAVPLVILYILATSTQAVSMDIILESFSADKVSGRIRGLFLTLFNLGFLFGPMLSALLLEKFNFYGIFCFLLIYNSLIFVFALLTIRKVNDNFHRTLKIIGIIRKVFHKKNIMRIYYIAFVLDFFYALMVIYTPLHLRAIGFEWSQIGLIFTIMLLPFVLFQYPAGIYADKESGEKELLIFSIILMGLATLSIYFISSLNIVLWVSVLFITRIGAALIEILRDSYFYKKIDVYDVDVIDFFRTSKPVAYILATGISSIIILFMPLKAAFILVTIIVLSALFPALKLRDNKSEKELRRA